MEHDQEMHAHHSMHDDPYTIYPPDLHSYNTSPSSFMDDSGQTRERFLPSDAFGASHRHDQHEAEHVYDSPQLTLDPSTLDLRSNSNENPRSSSANTSGSNNTTPTGSLRLSAYTQPNLSSSGVTTRRKARVALEQLQIQSQVGVHPEVQFQSPPQQQNQHRHRQSDMHDVHMHGVQIHVDDRNDHGIIGGGMGHEQTHGDPVTHHMYTMMSDPTSQAEYYLSSGTFSASPASISTPPDDSSHLDLQPNNPTSVLTPSSTSSVSMARAIRPNSLSLAMATGRPVPLVPLTPALGSPGHQHMSPSHVQHSQHSSHPHMHPLPYYSLSHNTGSPGFPSTPTTSHHTQGSSSSSHSSGHTRYSLRGSPGSRSFGRGHTRSSSYGTASTMSVRSSSPASSVASAFTSLSGGGSGSTPGSTSGPVGSPSSYGEAGDVQMPFTNASPRNDGGHPPDSHQVRSQSHPPLSMPTAHPALAAYSALLPQTGKTLLHPGPDGYMPMRGSHVTETGDSNLWPPHTHSHIDDLPSAPLGARMAESFRAQLPSKPIIPRAPHRKQKLANSDRKAICMYAKQHPSARQEDIAARYNVERSTISKILKNKERWLGCPDDDAKVARKRKPRFDDLELVLKHWVEGTKPQGIVLSDALIRSKAKEEARRLGILEDKFKASSGWLENFKHRVGIRKGKYIGREPWPEASDSEAEASPITTKHVQEQRMVWSADPASSSEHLTKGFWPATIAQTQSCEVAQTMEQAARPSTFQVTSDHIAMAHVTESVPDQGNEHKLGQASAPSQHTQTSSPSPLSRQEGRKAGVGMRKTRSRTLAEAREAEAAITRGLSSPSTLTSPTTPLSAVSVLAPAAHIEPNPRQGPVNSLTSLPPTSPISPTAADHPDGREASAGLDAALDFIGCQPQGFATAEELAVLKKLSRRMSRAELTRHLSMPSTPAGWNETEET